MSSAGQLLEAGRIPGERIATTEETTDSATFTAQTVVLSVTAPLVDGRTYRVRAHVGVDSGTVDDRITVRLVEDSAAGTDLQVRTVVITVATGSAYESNPEAEFTAGSTGNKTFVVTLELSSGTGNVFRAAGATFPSYLYVDYISG